MVAPTRQPEPTTPFFGSTYLEMQEDVLRAIGYTATTAPATLLDQTKRLIKTGCAQIAAMHPQDFWVEKYTTITTVANQGTYAAPKGMISLTSAVLDSVYLDAYQNDYKLKFLRTTNQTPYTEGAAVQYTVFWGVDNAAATAEPQPILELYPPPTAAGTLELYYRGYDNALSASGDFFRGNPAFSQMPFYYALSVILATIGETDRARLYKEMYENENAKLTMTNQRSRAEKATEVLPTFAKSFQPFRSGHGQVP